MTRPKKYLTESDRLGARREQKRAYMQKYRQTEHGFVTERSYRMSPAGKAVARASEKRSKAAAKHEAYLTTIPPFVGIDGEGIHDKSVPPVVSMKEVRAYARDLLSVELSKPKYSIAKRVQDAGYIHILRGMAYYTEWNESVSFWVRSKVCRKNGLPIDEVADSLHMSVSALISALSVVSTEPKLEDFLSEAEQTLGARRSSLMPDRYVLLMASGCRPLTNENGLTTEGVFDYLFQWKLNKKVIVGYGLGYDFENWLEALSRTEEGQAEYRNLVNGTLPHRTPIKIEGKDRTQYVRIGKFIVYSYIPRKMLKIAMEYTRKDGSVSYLHRHVYDCIGFFQSTFQKALKSWNLGSLVSAEIEKGKAERGSFTWEKIKSGETVEYTRQEIAGLVELMTRLWKVALTAFDSVEAGIKLEGSDCYGPGAFARKFLEAQNWTDEHPQLTASKNAIAEFKKVLKMHTDSEGWDYNVALPFSACYFGGRIEAATVGHFQHVFNYDIRSAYPAAMSRLPKWEANRIRFTKSKKQITKYLNSRYIGMYYVVWDFPKDWTWYPFPYRYKSGNVFFPAKGEGFVMSPELFTAIDIHDTEYFHVTCAYVLPHTEGLGRGDKPLPDEKRSTAGRKIEELYYKRAALKKQGNAGQLPIKLTLNSLYGKLLQQVGRSLDKLQLFNDLSAAWITSWCRATIWSVVGPHAKEKTIFAIQTDGIYSTERLPEADARLSSVLGEWDYEEYENFREFLPGVYDGYIEGKYTLKKRGMTREFEPDKAWEALTTGKRYKFRYSSFVGLRHALAQPIAFGNLKYQWVEIEKEYKCLLGSKRDSGTKPIYLNGREQVWTKPKSVADVSGALGMVPSKPFHLKFEQTPFVPETEEMMDKTFLEDSMQEEYFTAGIDE